MRRTVVALGILVVVLTLVGLRGGSDLSADVGQRTLLVGRWKAAAANDTSTVEFRHKSWSMFGDDTTSPMMSGPYVWLDDGTVNLNFVSDGVEKTITWKIQIDGNTLRTIDSTGGTLTWVRLASASTSPQADGPSEVAIPDVTASAPTLLRPSDLGRPVDADFRLISGAAGGPLYKPQTGNTAAPALNVDFLQVTNTRDLSANADWWVVSANASSGNGQRYLRYRAFQQTDILTVDDTQEAREAPANAAWYVAAITLGRSYETIVYGDSSKFTAGVEAKLHTFGASVQSITEHARLQFAIKARGIVGATDKAIFARSADEIMSAYKQDVTVPIYVVYRHIPGRQVKPSQPMVWTPDDDIKVEHDPVKCYCAEGQQVALVCRVRNNGPRSMDVTISARATTGSTSAQAETIGRVRIGAGQVVDAAINAPIRHSWGVNCSSLAECSCTATDANPSP